MFLRNCVIPFPVPDGDEGHYLPFADVLAQMMKIQKNIDPLISPLESHQQKELKGSCHIMHMYSMLRTLT